MNNVTYLTCYSKKMFEVTANRLISTFQNSNTEGKLVAYSEHSAPHALQLNDKHLHWFMRRYRNKIPTKIGGNAPPCLCRPDKHERGCVNSLWNRSAYRWFHKVVTIDQFILDNPLGSGYLVWLDCDCYFQQKVPAKLIDTIANGYDLCYMHGIKREAIESGILIFNLNLAGKSIIDKWMDCFLSGRFISDHRWDDGFQLTQVVKSLVGYTLKDLAEGKHTVDVAEHSVLTPYIRHLKGVHANRYGI